MHSLQKRIQRQKSVNSLKKKKQNNKKNDSFKNESRANLKVCNPRKEGGTEKRGSMSHMIFYGTAIANMYLVKRGRFQ